MNTDFPVCEHSSSCISACSGDSSADPARQANIIATGNYNFFNLLTIALCVPLLDDACLPARVAAWLLPAATPSPQAPGACPAPSVTPKKDLCGQEPPDEPSAPACAAPGGSAVGGPGWPGGGPGPRGAPAAAGVEARRLAAGSPGWPGAGGVCQRAHGAAQHCRMQSYQLRHAFMYSC